MDTWKCSNIKYLFKMLLDVYIVYSHHVSHIT